MKRAFGAVSALLAGTLSAHAGGIERSTQSVAILFEKGSHVEFSMGAFNPDVSGTVAGGAVTSGDMAKGYGTFAFGYKEALSTRLDMAVILDEPVGVNVAYPAGAAPYPLAGSTADLDALALTALLRFKIAEGYSVHGGLRAQPVQGEVSIPLFGYGMTTRTDREIGYVLGVGWEKPEIAARVALTYNSAIRHQLRAQETFSPTPTAFETEIPQSVNLEFQTGIARDTLLFGSVRWVDWSVFDITPPAFLAATGYAISDIEKDTVTYNLGIGRRFSENWAGAVTFGYEPASGALMGNLAPTDGYRSIGVAASYMRGGMTITGGMTYVDVGDATTMVVGGDFRGNSGLGAGLKVSYGF
ncbi:hypothetical protein [Defluviimonas salinarum]|uniref:Long-chain fatty acid transport protein n=1 Tax=Defluviimonas salinarum TaxID=2992147 RepID=A0ABT3J5F0_9RHOB|nr:hypothetical protein [Defluviimonas salinarum]MCW3782908.1 hypothetical protein [Defluviimonas salinarum]